MKLAIVIASVMGVIAAFSAWAQSAAKGDSPKGKQIATQVCAACHGADGNSPSSATPNLAGQHAEYITKQLANFKSKDGKAPERKSDVMAGMAASLSPDDVKNIAAYYSQQTPKPGTGKATKEMKALGEMVYRGGNSANGVPACAGCHSPNGAGIPSLYPRLAGQYAEYTLGQLKNFRSGERANDPAKAMQTIAAKMTEQEMRAVSEVIAGLR